MGGISFQDLMNLRKFIWNNKQVCQWFQTILRERLMTTGAFVVFASFVFSDLAESFSSEEADGKHSLFENLPNKKHFSTTSKTEANWYECSSISMILWWLKQSICCLKSSSFQRKQMLVAFRRTRPVACKHLIGLEGLKDIFLVSCRFFKKLTLFLL